MAGKVVTPSDQPGKEKARLGPNLQGVARCPHCNIANPQLVKIWRSDQPVPRATTGPTSRWAVYSCTSCGNLISAKGNPHETAADPIVIEIFPKPKAAHEDVPSIARTFLQQAYESLHAPDAAALMAGSAVDAMLKHLGYKEGTLYTRIDKAVEDHVLTENMGLWAHEVRLGSNRPRHSDENKPHVSSDEAKQAVEFAEALGNFLFVLTARINRGIEAAKSAEPRPVATKG